MNKSCLFVFNLFLSLLILSILKTNVFALELSPNIVISPKVIVQGDPVLIEIISTSSPKQIYFDSQNIPVFMYEGKPHGLIGIDIRQKIGTYEIKTIFTDGTEITTPIIVNEREKIEAPLGIPEKLGGNTPVAATNLVNNLAKENATLINLRTGRKAFWIKPFRGPLATLSVTDPYGYNRKTGEYTIVHKGTDFHAEEGTKVYAMNRGVVRIARTYTIYGKTIVVDHGFGLNTLYMHLSKIYVNVGELVLPGQLIGLSGKTGYAEIPHLHISVKINGISIDPEKFLEFFK